MNLPAALITGANGGLGTTVTEMFRGAGFRVAAVARSWKEPSDEMTLRIAADLTSASEAVAAADAAKRAFGGLDALVHLAGGFEGGAKLEETSDETWERMWNINLRTAVNAMRAVIPGMHEAGRGRIVVIGSLAGAQPPAGLSAYAASKAALHAVVLSAAAELKSAGVTVNALLPSTIDTPANRAAMGEAKASRWVQPSSLGSLALWLCSDAGRDVTGSLIPVTGRV